MKQLKWCDSSKKAKATSQSTAVQQYSRTVQVFLSADPLALSRLSSFAVAWRSTTVLKRTSAHTPSVLRGSLANQEPEFGDSTIHPNFFLGFLFWEFQDRK